MMGKSICANGSTGRISNENGEHSALYESINNTLVHDNTDNVISVTDDNAK